MFKKIALSLSFLVFFSFCLSSFAALSKSSGLYVEGNVGTATKTDGGIFLNGGYRFNAKMAMEAGFAFLKHTYMDVLLKRMIPFDNGVDLFYKVGPAVRSLNLKYIEACAGVGIGYAFTPNVSGNSQLIWISGGNYAFTVGIKYIF